MLKQYVVLPAHGFRSTVLAQSVALRLTIPLASAVGTAGVAPAVTMRSHRVFPHSGGDATNYDIMNAIDRALQDGCHIINLSLGGGDEDEAISAAIGSAFDSGVPVFAAAGNDGRKPVSFPAALPLCVDANEASVAMPEVTGRTANDVLSFQWEGKDETALRYGSAAAI